MNERNKIQNTLHTIRMLVWVYFILLIFEGVLRKWILPELADPLLLVRDPFLLLIYVIALSSGHFPFNGYVFALAGIGLVASITGMTVGSQNLLVTAYGFDSLFFHLPFIFIIPRVMDERDVVKVGKCMLLFTIPMALLMAIQFRSPPEALINCGAKGGIGSQLGGAFGKIRPPGFFTFITGAAQFLALATVFLIYGFWNRNNYSKTLLIVAGFAIAISAVVSTSRLTLGGIGTVFVMIGVVVCYNRNGVNNLLGLFIPLGCILVTATNLDIFHEGREVFEARLLQAGDLGNGLAGTAANWTLRVFGDFHGGFRALESAPIFGAGLGVGTNVGARILSGSFGFLLAEGEWARVILELGPLLGIPYLVIRALVGVKLYSTAAKCAKLGNALPMLLFGSCIMLIVVGQFSQATTLGFAVFGAGLCLAAANVVSRERCGYDDLDEPGRNSQSKTVKQQGCSRYAKLLRACEKTHVIESRN